MAVVFALLAGGCGFVPVSEPAVQGEPRIIAPLHIVLRNRTANEASFGFEGDSEGSGSSGLGSLSPCAISPLEFEHHDRWSFTLDGRRVIDSTDGRMSAFPGGARPEFTIVVDVFETGPLVVGVHLGRPGPEADVPVACDLRSVPA